MADGVSTVSQKWARKMKAAIRESVLSEDDCDGLRVTYHERGAPYGPNSEEIIRWWEERVFAKLEDVHAKRALGLPWYETWGLKESDLGKLKFRRR
jgi:hypothetical protein